MKNLALFLFALLAFSSCMALTPEQQESVVSGTSTTVGMLATAATGGNVGVGAAVTAGVATLLNWFINRKGATPT